MTVLRDEKTRRAAALGVLAAALAFCLFLIFGRAPEGSGGPAVSATGKWTCSMCPQFILPEPGKCPKCFMDLIPLEEGAMGGGRLELILPYAAAEAAGIEAEIAEAAEGAPAAREDGEPVLAVPASAVLENLGRYFVFTESDDGENLTFTMREITFGGRSGDTVFVLGGLDEGEAVAVRGAFRIDSALQILGKVSLVSVPEDLARADDDTAPPYMPAERSDEDVRARGADLDSWFREYEQVRAALAKDDASGAEQASRRIAGLLAAGIPGGAGESLPQLRQQLAAAAETLAAAPTLDGKRDSFEKLSEGMVLAARRYGAPEGGLRIVFCPMAFGGTGAHWLQPQEEVDNPYHGLEMPLCGWQVEYLPE